MDGSPEHQIPGPPTPEPRTPERRSPERRSSERRSRRGMLAAALEQAEHFLNVGIALALAVGGVALFVNVLITFGRHVGDEPFVATILRLLDGLILVFIVTELLHTLRSVIAEGVLLTEPFLVVGIVAIVRRLIVISAEASGFVGHADFDDLMVEMGVLVGGLLVLGLVIFLLRRSGREEPGLQGPPGVV